ncbi:MAG: type II toxin-antitoxin system prevent-host-death family antitoxin [Planctomycetes bacterium]|nr:type II toxin-antitoxin system prevent-host-death family antitoxin [Planctomycetota bacterium]
MIRPKTTTLGAFEAKNRLSELIERVSKGESVVITRHGTPIARLVPYDEGVERGQVQEAIAGLRKLRKGMRLRGLKLRDLIDEGRA